MSMRSLRARLVAVGAALAVLAFGLPIAAAQTQDPPVTDDPYLAAQWGLDRIRASEAWELASGQGIKVAVIGWGVDLDHPDLQCAEKIELVDGFNLAAGTAEPAEGWQTNAAGIIAACTGNQVGIAGIAPDATLLPFRIWNSQLTGNTHLVAAIEKAVAAGAHVIAFPPRTDRLFDDAGEASGITLSDRMPIRAAVEDAIEKGVLFVAPAGDRGAGSREGRTPTAAGCQWGLVSRDILCVTATGPSDVLPVYAPVVDRDDVVVAAPGGLGASHLPPACRSDATTGVLSLWLYPSGAGNCDERGAGYKAVDSTIAAAAHVAGVAALGYEEIGGNRDAEAAGAVTDAIITNAADIGPPGADRFFGAGMIDATATVASLTPEPNGSPSATATPTSTPTTEPTTEPTDLPTQSPTPSATPTPSPTEPPIATDDPFVAQQWALDKINAPDIWDRTQGRDVEIAIIDSGVDLDHEDLSCAGKLRVVAGANVPDRGAPPDDIEGHGTHLAGIAAACTGNGTGIAGIAPAATILPFQVATDDGDPDTPVSISRDDVALAIRRATDRGAHIINLALNPSIPIESYVGSFPAIEVAIRRAVDRGVVVVAAAGNSAMPLCEFPALAARVLCVGATDADDRKSWSSTFANKDDGQALVAPGGLGVASVFCDLYDHNILSTYPQEFDDCRVGEKRQGYRTLSGTSMAAAHVSGAAALLYAHVGSARNQAGATKVAGALLDGAFDLGVDGPDPVYGRGRVDVAASVAILEGEHEAAPAADDSPLPRLAAVFEPSASARTARVSTTSTGAEAQGPSETPAISADGRYVAFTSTASNLRPAGNPFRQVFVKDTLTGEIELVSKNRAGQAATACTGDPSISADGRYVAFSSGAKNLVKNDTNGPTGLFSVFICEYPDVFVHDRRTGITTRVSVAADGAEATKRHGDISKSWTPVISDDGTTVLFWSNAENLTPQSSGNKWGHLYAHDRDADDDGILDEASEPGATSTVMVDVDNDGVAQNHDLPYKGIDISADGRYVSFSMAGLLGDGHQSAYVRDVVAGTTVEVSVNDDGEEAIGGSELTAISADGRYVAFGSWAANLVPDDTNNLPQMNHSHDVFVHDRDADEDGVFDERGEPGAINTERVSVTNAGGEVMSHYRTPSISADGRYVGMVVDPPAFPDETRRNRSGFTIKTVLVHDRETDVTELIPVANNGAEGNDHSSTALGGGSSNATGRDAPALSADGRYVVFHSFASNLVDDTNDRVDVFVRDRGPDLGTADIISERDIGVLRVSGWASFQGATLTSADDPDNDSSAPTEAGAELSAARVIYRPERAELALQWDLADLASIHAGRIASTFETPRYALGPVIYGFRFTVDGTAYEVRGTRFGASGKRKLSQDAYFALFSCATTCSEVGPLAGAVGTMDEQASVVIPLDKIGADEGAQLGDVRAFSAAGAVDVASLHEFDAVALGDSDIPARAIGIATAPRGAPPHEITFGDATLRETSFTGLVSDVQGMDLDVWAQACLGDACTRVREVRPDDRVPFERASAPPEDDVVLPTPGPDPTAIPEPRPQRPPVSYLSAPPGHTRIIAGAGTQDGLAALRTTLGAPKGVATGARGLYISDTINQQIRVVGDDGNMKFVAGSVVGFQDGSLHAARFRYPEGIAVDERGVVYVADRYNDRVRAIDPSLGLVTTVAGDGEEQHRGDGGAATEASLYEPRDVAIGLDQSIYIADYGNSVVRRIAPDGTISTFAGTGTAGPAIDGVAATNSPIGLPSGVAVHPVTGDVYISEEGNCLVRKVAVATGVITTVAGTQAPDTDGNVVDEDAHCVSKGDGRAATDAYLASPQAVEVDSEGRIYIAEDPDGGRVRVVDPNGTITTIAGNGETGCPDGAVAATEGLTGPASVAVDQDGALYVASAGWIGGGRLCGRVFRIHDGMMTPYAGSSASSAQAGIPANAANTFGVTAVAYGRDGRAYFTSEAGKRIWAIDGEGMLELIAGDEDFFAAAIDGPALDARFGHITAMEFDDRGRLWIVDRGARKIKVLSNGVVKTVAGMSGCKEDECRVGREGPSREVVLDAPQDLAIAPDGSIYFTESVREGRIRVLRDGHVFNFAGDVDGSGDCLDNGDCVDGKYFAGDGEGVSKAQFQFPMGIDIGPDGSLYISDHFNHRIRKITPEGDVSTIAGDGGIEHGTEEPRRNGYAPLSSIAYPNDVAVDDHGNVFVSDGPDFTHEPSDGVIWQVSPRGMLTRVAGTGLLDRGHDGESPHSALEDPEDVAVTPAGLLVADGRTLRLVAPPTDGWPDRPVGVRCDPFGYTDLQRDVTYNAGSIRTDLTKDWLDILGGDVRTTAENIHVTLDLKDLGHPGGAIPPGDEFGSDYAWAYLFKDADIQDQSSTIRSNGSGPLFAYYISARMTTVGSAAEFEYGIAEMIGAPAGLGLWDPIPFGTAEGTIDVDGDRVTLVAPVAGFSDFPLGFEPPAPGTGLDAGERVIYQEFAAGVITTPHGNLGLRDIGPNLRSRDGRFRFGVGTTRSYEIGRNCEDYGPIAEDPPPVKPDLPVGPDEYLDLQWALDTIGAPAAWEQNGAKGDGIKVAVIDSGIDLDHEDFSCTGKIGPGAAVVNGVVDERRSAPEDVNGHGTGVAGVIGACANNSVGIAGTAPEVTVLPYRVVSDEGELDFRDVGAAVRHATKAGAHVINLSLGPVVSAASYAPDVLEENDTQAIEDAIGAGVVVVAAAGNDSFPLCSYPALVKNVVCVGATDRFDLKSYYSSFPNKLSGGPALVAPGGTGTAFCDFPTLDIITTNSVALDDDCDGREGYATASGTSLAAPHVSGAAALVYDALGGERSPAARASVVGALTSTAVDYGTRGYDPVYGSGRVDAAEAVRSVTTVRPNENDPSPEASASPSASASPNESSPPNTSPPPSASASPSASGSTSPEVSSSPSSTESQGTASSTLSATRTNVAFGKPVRLAGQVTTEGECETSSVNIFKRRHGKTRLRMLRTVEVGDDGRWSTKISSKRSAFYLAEPDAGKNCAAEASTPVEIKVRSKVVVKRLKRCATNPRLRGVVRPNHKKTKVVLKKKKRGGWRRFDRDRLDRRSRFVLQPPSCKGRYKVVWRKQAVDNIAGRAIFDAKKLKGRGRQSTR